MNRSATAVHYRINKPQWSHAVILTIIHLPCFAKSLMPDISSDNKIKANPYEAPISSGIAEEPIKTRTPSLGWLFLTGLIYTLFCVAFTFYSETFQNILPGYAFFAIIILMIPFYAGVSIYMLTGNNAFAPGLVLGCITAFLSSTSLHYLIRRIRLQFQGNWATKIQPKIGG